VKTYIVDHLRKLTADMDVHLKNDSIQPQTIEHCLQIRWFQRHPEAIEMKVVF
jgi:hypothetical protein